MISVADLMKRIGVGGRLVPFFKCVCVYFLAGPWGAGGEGGAGMAGAVAAKCAPVLCLLLAVALNHGHNLHDSGRYARRISLGLALSAVGDALLVWPQHLAAGMAAFALAHIAYLAAFGLQARPLGNGAVVLGASLGAATAAYLRLVRPPPPLLDVAVPLYAGLLAGMAWRAAARALDAPASRPARHAALGAAMFLVSDAILGYSLFGADGPLAYKQVLVMSTYYLGQLGIALSALEPQPAPAPAPADREPPAAEEPPAEAPAQGSVDSQQ